MKNLSPFHEGEIEVQKRVGALDIEEKVASSIRPYMPDQHREFFAHLPFVVVAARDLRQRPWVTLLSNAPGFCSSPTPKTLRIQSALCPGDALNDALKKGSALGLLGLQYATRRRNRVNVQVRSHQEGVLSCEVVQSFGNCPKYIPQKALERFPRHPSPALRSSSLSPKQRAMISACDSFFIGSGYQGAGWSGGMDASHRGGALGFVRVLSATRFRFPDYSGNFFFNTLGNLLKDPRAGFFFADFESGTQVQVSGEVSVHWKRALDGEDDDAALRWLTVDVEKVVEIEGALPLTLAP